MPWYLASLGQQIPCIFLGSSHVTGKWEKRSQHNQIRYQGCVDHSLQVMNPGTCNFHTTIYVYPHLHLRHPLHPLNTKIFRTPSPIGHYNRDLLRTNRRWFYFKVLDKNDVDKTRLKHADFPFHSILFWLFDNLPVRLLSFLSWSPYSPGASFVYSHKFKVYGKKSWPFPQASITVDVPISTHISRGHPPLSLLLRFSRNFCESI